MARPLGRQPLRCSCPHNLPHGPNARIKQRLRASVPVRIAPRDPPTYPTIVGRIVTTRPSWPQHPGPNQAARQARTRPFRIGLSTPHSDISSVPLDHWTSRLGPPSPPRGYRSLGVPAGSCSAIDPAPRPSDRRARPTRNLGAQHHARSPSDCDTIRSRIPRSGRRRIPRLLCGSREADGVSLSASTLLGPRPSGSGSKPRASSPRPVRRLGSRASGAVCSAGRGRYAGRASPLQVCLSTPYSQ